MELSANNLHKHIQLYLNEVEDYDSSEQSVFSLSKLYFVS